MLTAQEIEEWYEVKPRSIYKTNTAWAVLCRSENILDGYREWFEGTTGHPCRTLLFDTREQARAYIKSRYAYLHCRPDLRAEPHGWRMPFPVRVNITIELEQERERS